ncbi:HNH endonuclease [Xenorhabdus bovienii]|uniref:HNH endonuclease n=1 Tax=Xenorhabdus bovienii TaxID=40576 RepID=UPI0023B25225|nr:HNH endonuclease [Xenorhabdus bovienii]MDE9455411.1 HNH endonuclease [Xenorhabdus bovienii]
MYSKIVEPYNLLKDEETVISVNFKTDKDWSKSVFNSIKSNIVKSLRDKQENKCCYCRSELGFDLKAVDIEHIIPKSLYPNFTFNMKNLALSCPGCNTSKGSKDVLHKPITSYPLSGSNIKIIHPHFDDYYSSINIHNSAIFEGKDDKGCETIKLCKLYRLNKVLENKQRCMSNQSPIQQIIESIRNADDNEKSELMALLKPLILFSKK